MARRRTGARPQRVELAGGGVLLVKPLGFRRVHEVMRAHVIPETGKIDLGACEEIFLRDAVVGFEHVEGADGRPLSFPADLEEVLDDLGSLEFDAVERAYSQKSLAVEADLGNSAGPSSA